MSGTEAEQRAALAFADIVALMADPGRKLTPDVLLHVLGLLGALLVSYSEWELDDVVAEIRRLTGSAEALDTIRQHMVDQGLIEAAPRREESH